MKSMKEKAARGQTIRSDMSRDDSSHKVAEPKKAGGSPTNLSASSSAKPNMKGG
jgi:hypothetical protein